MSIWGLNNIFNQYQPLFGGTTAFNAFTPNFSFFTPQFNCGYFPFNFYSPNYPYTNSIFSGGFPAQNSFNFMPALNFTAPMFNFATPSFTAPSFPTPSFSPAPTGLFDFLKVTTTRTTQTPAPRRTSTTINTETNLPTLKKAGYNTQKASRLASEIAKVSTEGGFDNYCARHVKEAIEDAGLGTYQSGHGYQMAGILQGNKNFKEISTKNIDLSSLPAGCVLVYDRGVAGYSSDYGHTEITLGNGTAASGGITHNIRQGARVFVPV